jgi:hypothetical protein
MAVFLGVVVGVLVEDYLLKLLIWLKSGVICSTVPVLHLEVLFKQSSY